MGVAVEKEVFSCVLIGEAYVQGVMDGEGFRYGTKAGFVIRYADGPRQRGFCKHEQRNERR